MTRAIQVLPGSGKNSPFRTIRKFRIVAAAPLLFLALTACPDQHPQSAGTKVVFQDRLVEVPVRCPVTKPVKPKPLARPLPSDPARLIDLLVAKLTELMGPGGYVERADQAITTCTKP